MFNKCIKIKIEDFLKVRSFSARIFEWAVARPPYTFIAIIWPILFLHRYIVGNSAPGYSISISNDFLLYYVYKPYLLEFLSNFSFPLWSPAEAGGFPILGNALAQPLYPLNVILAIYYKVTGGFTSYDYHWFVLFHVSVMCVGLFKWLRSLHINIHAALFAALIMAVSLKVTDILRFPNAICAAAWLPWILLGLTLSVRRKTGILGWLITVLGVVMLCTAGYPYLIVYSFFLVGPYVLILSSNKTYFLFDMNDEANVLGSFMRLAITVSGLLVGGAITSPWIFEVREVIKYTRDRSLTDFEFATKYSTDALETVASFIYPPVANPEGWVYFGSLSLMLILSYIFLTLFKTHVQRKGENLFILTSVVWASIIILISLGGNSPIFEWLWNQVPVIQGMRLWQRILIVIVPILALLLARAAELMIINRVNMPNADVQEKHKIYIAAAAAMLVVIAQASLYLFAAPHYYWLHYAVGNLIADWWFIISGAVSFIAYIALMVALYKRVITEVHAIFIALLIVAVDVWPESSTQWSGGYPDRYAQLPQLTSLKNMKSHLDVPRVNMYGAIWPEFLPSWNLGIVSSWYFSSYVSFYLRYFDYSGQPLPELSQEEIDSVEQLLGIDGAKRLFLSNAIDHATPSNFMQDVYNIQENDQGRIEVESYDGSSLIAKVYAKTPLYLSFIDNYSHGWTVDVNGQAAEPLKLFETFKSVRLSEGENIVQWEYTSELISSFREWTK